MVAAESWGRLLYASSRFVSEQRRVEQALVACRRAVSAGAQRRLAQLLAPYFSGSKTDYCRSHRIGWNRYYRQFGLQSPDLTASLLLKAPGPDGEKGVLYAPYEYNPMRIVAHTDASRFLKDYVLVSASSWSPTDFALAGAFAGLSDDPLYLGISHFSDIAVYNIAAPAIEPLPILASDWIDPAGYAPRPHGQREIDFLMVANFSRFKRHWLLFQALRRMPPNLRVTLIGMAIPGRNADTLREEARAFGVRQDLEIRTNLSIEEVAACQCNARVSLIFSRREGSCVATAESLFADSPVGMMRDAHIGSSAYMNEATGVLLDYADLTQQLESLHERSASFAPRQWALANITAQRSSARLNQILKDRALATKRPWTEDIAPMHWRYVPSYLNPGDRARLQPAVEELATRYGVRLKVFEYRPS